MRRLFGKARDTIRTPRKGGGGPPRTHPPEILQEIFVHCCGDEYIDFFSHSPFEHEILNTCQSQDGSKKDKNIRRKWDYERPPWNTAYVLKAVCKEWRAIVEGTPQLWQRLHLEFQPIPITGTLPSVHLSETQLTDFSRRYANMLKHVFLSRSGGMALHLQIGVGTGPSQINSQNAGKLRGVFMKPLLHALAEESHRWTSLELAGISLKIVIDEFFRPSSSNHGLMSLPNLRHLSSNSSPEYDDTTISASQISKLFLSGTPFCNESIVKINLTQSQHLTTLVMSDWYSYHLDRELSTRRFIEVLKAVPNLAHFHWQGRFGRLQHFVLHATTNPVVLEKLLSITMEDSNLEFCRLLPRLISCPKLESLRLLVGEPIAVVSTQTPPIVDEAIFSIQTIIQAAPFIKNVTVMQCKSLLWTLGTMKNVKVPSGFEYVFYSGSQAQFVNALQRDKHWSKLSPNSPLDKLPVEIMTVESTSKLQKYIPPDRIPPPHSP
ncbi:hypothetical protein H1R20_g6225, partial [Candolleomyces eurysporus]